MKWCLNFEFNKYLFTHTNNFEAIAVKKRPRQTSMGGVTRSYFSIIFHPTTSTHEQ